MVFEILVQKLVELGFYEFFLPFLVAATISYALLRKSKILGESALPNAIVAISVAFMVLGFPVLAGISLQAIFAKFFTQIIVWMLVFIVGFLLASFFYPDFTRFLTEMFVERKSRIVYVLIVIGILTLVLSGMITIITGPLAPPKPGEPPTPPLDITIVLVGLMLFAVILLIATRIVIREGA